MEWPCLTLMGLSGRAASEVSWTGSAGVSKAPGVGTGPCSVDVPFLTFLFW